MSNPAPDSVPASRALAPDVHDEEAAVDELGIYAEGLIAMLMDEVPALRRWVPEALDDLEEFVRETPWVDELDPEFREDRFIPALGAWLGRLLVVRLDGRWVPRDDREETQVVVGGRAFSPFVRARRFVEAAKPGRGTSVAALYREAAAAAEGGDGG